MDNLLRDAAEAEENVWRNRMIHWRADASRDYLRGRGILFLSILLILLLLDGARRDREHLQLHLAQARAGVAIRLPSGQLTAKVGRDLRAGTALTTDATGQALLTLPEGSVLRLEPQSTLEINDLRYTRYGRHDVTVSLLSGTARLHLSPRFGKTSLWRIVTPVGIVLANHGDIQVSYTAAGLRITPSADIVKGPPYNYHVTFHGKLVLTPGLIVVQRPDGLMTTAPGVLSADAALTVYEKRAMPWIAQVEWWLWQPLDVIGRRVGVTVGGIAASRRDAAEEERCRKGLVRLRKALLAALPNTVNPVTLAEVAVDAEERVAILRCFGGQVLERYSRTGPQQFEVEVRAPDSAGTLYLLTEKAITRKG